MMLKKTLNPWLCTLLLTFAACDKDESLGEVDTGQSEGESDSGIACPADAMVCADGSSVGREGPDCEFAACPDTACPKDAMLCPDGTSVSREGPNCEFAPCEDTGCPADALECPDGSYVGREGPNCEFAPCPDTPPVSCEPGLVPAEPATCPTEGGAPPQLPVAGCYEPCTEEGAACENGDVCTLVQINPCPCDEGETCCAACASDGRLCLPATQDAACDAIAGNTFRSIEELECGLGEDGVVLCNWRVTFDDAGGWDWQYSDVGDSGAYECSAGELTIAKQPDLEARYDLDTGVLTWDGNDYVLSME